MSEIVALTGNGQEGETKMRIGLLRLTDAAPVIVAHEFGFFADEGIDAELYVEPSWANIADKLAYGFLDAALIVPPLAFAVELGMRGAAQRLVIPTSVSLGGNTITLARGLAKQVHEVANRASLSLPHALASVLGQHPGKPLSFGIVHAYSTHNLLLRYWLTTGGIDLMRDVKLTVVPPAAAAEALKSGQIAGFCAGAPWGDIAARQGVGSTIATSKDVWQNAPEKAFAVRAVWADTSPGALQGSVRALLRAAQFCDSPANSPYTASLLSRKKYLNVDSHAILSSLPGGAIRRDNVSSFYANAATFPWRSHGLWFLKEMTRWGLIDHGLDLPELAARVYRPDIYRAAVASMDVPLPLADKKIEGAHDGPWQLSALPNSISMGADLFCDGAVFDPDCIKSSADV